MKIVPVVILAAGWVVLNVPFHGNMHVDVSANSKNWSLTGTALNISSPCADEVDIMPGNEAGQITVNATAMHQDQLDALNINSAGGTVTIGANSCPDDSIPTFFGGVAYKITVTVPAGTNISINEGSSTDYTIGNTGGDLAIQSNGSGDVSAGQVHNLNVSLTDDGDAHILNVTGAITANLTGNGDLHIDSVSSPRTALTLSSDGDVKIDSGNAGILTADMSGSGDVALPDVASLTVSDRGDGDVTIGNVNGNLNASLNGDGDLHSATVAGNATLVLNSGGDADIAHVAGHVTQSVTGDGDVTIGN